MNRTIEFRGQRVDTKEWVYGYYLYDGNTHRIFEIGKQLLTNTGIYTGVEVLPSTVGQFTGMTDKNGNEIYEGDVDSYYGVVRWSDGAYLHNEVDDCKYDLLHVTYPRFKIIGNIHDNPELTNKIKEQEEDDFRMSLDTPDVITR